jgi:serine/threonine protein kinase
MALEMLRLLFGRGRDHRRSDIRATPIGELAPQGVFNNGIQLYRRRDNHQYIIKKIFRPEHLPEHARHERDTLLRLGESIYFTRLIDAHITRKEGWLWLEGCEKGTLQALITNHENAKQPIPEKFIWHVFFSLVEALSYLQYGNVDKGRENNDRNWIFHRAIHPGNVFIAGGGTGHRDPLRITLGSLGSSISRREYEDGLRRGKNALRQSHGVLQVPEFKTPDEEANGSTDVYQVALVVLAFCRLSMHPMEYINNMSYAGDDYSGVLNGYLFMCCSLDVKASDRPSVCWLQEIMPVDPKAGISNLGKGLLLDTPRV